MLSCGEPSGDLYAGALTAEICRLDPTAEVYGLGGERLAAAGGRLVAEYEGLAVTGLAEALSVLPRSWAAYRRLLAAARAERPDVFVAIDFPDFNFRLGSSIAALGIPVVYYISPQVWAWRVGRLRTMKRFVTRALVIFPFEAALYREAGIPVAFVGHPLLDLVTSAGGRDAFRRAASVGSRCGDGGGPAGEPAKRAPRDPARSGRRGRADRAGAAVGPARGGPGATPV